MYQNEDGTIWIENTKGEEFGIISSTGIIDWDGIPFQQDWDNGTTYIDFVEENGETSRLVFSNNNVEIVEASLL